MIPRITDLTPLPVIGKFYLVPTVHYIYHGRYDDGPIIGPKHEDKAIIGFPHLHYHVDERFLSNSQVQFILRPSEWKLEFILAQYPLCRMHDDDKEEPHPPVVWRKKLFQRHMRYAHSMPTWLWKLQAAYQGKCLINGICPHRGAHIATVKPDEDGLITCPLHGLRWSAATGELVRINRNTYQPVVKLKARLADPKHG